MRDLKGEKIILNPSGKFCQGEWEGMEDKDGNSFSPSIQRCYGTPTEKRESNQSEKG